MGNSNRFLLIIITITLIIATDIQSKSNEIIFNMSPNESPPYMIFDSKDKPGGIFI